jgi:hypothetical protein
LATVHAVATEAVSSTKLWACSIFCMLNY